MPPEMAELDPLPGPALERPKRIGKYEILAGLNTGGMAELSLAMTTGPGGFRKFAALKRILPHVQPNEEFIRMFLDEARITAMLSHPGIAQVYELGDEGGELYIAMEFVPGQDVSRLVRACRKLGKRPPAGLACMVVRDVCLALHYAHGFKDPSGRPSPVVHRDVTPKNVMVTYDGAVKMVDFGIALAKGRLESTAAGTVKGTANYMSPEQIQARPLDGRSDLYSAGVILHELLCGQRLFQGGNDAAVLQQIMHGEVQSPRELNPQVPPGLSEVVMKAISRKREDRFLTGKEMARAIEAVCAGTLYDSEDAAAFMRQLFKERISQIRSLLDLSSPTVNSKALRLAAGALAEDETNGLSNSDVRSSVATAAHTGDVEAPSDAEEPRTAKIRTTPGPQSRTDQTAASKVVLVVDRDLSVLASVQGWVQPMGHRVLMERSFAAALARVEADPPDLLICAVTLPDGNGFQLCQQLRQRAQDRYFPILFLSPNCTLEERMEGVSAGGDDFIRTPIEPPELTARVKAHLQRLDLLRGSARSQPPAPAPRRTPTSKTPSSVKRRAK
ncbi:MAG: protein kinase [Myxococcota bacterium]|nr:protein kinase [Myxococcota bacterium]